MAERNRMRARLANAKLVVSAWDGPLRVGLARALSDFAYCTYLSDLCLRVSHQRQGIGREWIRRVRELGGQATVV
ncbi:MAG: hypothetical protein ACKO3N_07615 [Verrucomicrobiota bacterium]